MATLLLYTINSQKSADISRLCSGLGHKLRLLRRAELSCTIASLLSGRPQPARREAVGSPLSAAPEVLIFSGFSSSELDGFLKAYREADIAPIPLKAVVTPSNFLWTIDQLTAELRKEHSLLG